MQQQPNIEMLDDDRGEEYDGDEFDFEAAAQRFQNEEELRRRNAGDHENKTTNGQGFRVTVTPQKIPLTQDAAKVPFGPATQPAGIAQVQPGVSNEDFRNYIKDMQEIRIVVNELKLENRNLRRELEDRVVPGFQQANIAVPNQQDPNSPRNLGGAFAAHGRGQNQHGNFDVHEHRQNQQANFAARQPQNPYQGGFQGGLYGARGQDQYAHVEDPVQDIGNPFVMTALAHKDKGSPFRSLDISIKGNILTKKILTSDIHTFEPWKRYIKDVFDSSWLSCLSKLNIYKVPPQDTWEEWDRSCFEGRAPNCQRNTYWDIMAKTNDNTPVVSYLDEHGREQLFSSSTHVDIMNTAFMAVYKKYGNQLFHTIGKILNNSIDVSTMKSVLNPNQIHDHTNLRNTYISALLFHEFNSDITISNRVNKFTSPTDFRMGQNEPPMGFLKRLQEESDVINSMIPTGEQPAINDRMLRSKFISMAKQIDYLRPSITAYEIGYIDMHGRSQQHTLERYVQLLQVVYRDRKGGAPNGFHHKGFASTERDDTEDLELGMALSESMNNKPAVCFSFRDTGICKFGKDCKFEHERGKIQSKPSHRANLSKEALIQYAENLEHESALLLKDQKKKFVRRFKSQKNKMDEYKKKLGEQNSSKGPKERVAVVQEIAAAAKESKDGDQDSNDEDPVSDLSEMESEDSGKE
jgi:hypothetical protein